MKKNCHANAALDIKCNMNNNFHRGNDSPLTFHWKLPMTSAHNNSLWEPWPLGIRRLCPRDHAVESSPDLHRTNRHRHSSPSASASWKVERVPRFTRIPRVHPAAWRDSLLFIGVVSCVQSEFFSNKSLSAAQRVVGQEARMETLQRALEKKQQNRLTVLFPFGHQGAFLQQRFYVENFD